MTQSQAAEECFEKTSRAVFKFNMILDDVIFEPVAKGYNKLPSPIKTGTGNFTSNIGTLLSILLKKNSAISAEENETSEDTQSLSKAAS